MRRFITNKLTASQYRHKKCLTFRRLSSHQLRPASTPLITKEESSNDKLASRVTVQGAILNASLCTCKFGVGVLSSSPALISDAAHSMSDLASDAVTLYSYKKSREPADWDHPFGHGKFESVGTNIVGTILLLTGTGVGYHSVLSLWTGATGTDSLLYEQASISPNYAIAAAAASLLAKEMMYRITLDAGKKCDSSVIVANAHHHRSDSLSSGVALIGIAGGMLFGVPYLDPCAGILVAGMVIKTGYDVSLASLNELLDTQMSAEFITSISALVHSVPGAALSTGKNSIRAHKSGPNVLADIVIKVDGSLSASSAHQIGEHVRRSIIEHFLPTPMFVTVHIDPSIRQEYDCPHLKQLLDTPDIIESKIRASIKQKCPHIMGVSELTILYKRVGMIDVKLNIMLHPDMTVRRAGVIGTDVRKKLRQTFNCVDEVDVHLELEEIDTQNKQLMKI